MACFGVRVRGDRLRRGGGGRARGLPIGDEDRRGKGRKRKRKKEGEAGSGAAGPGVRFLKCVFTPFPGLVWRFACSFWYLLTEIFLLVKFQRNRAPSGEDMNLPRDVRNGGLLPRHPTTKKRPSGTFTKYFTKPLRDRPGKAWGAGIVHRQIPSHAFLKIVRSGQQILVRIYVGGAILSPSKRAKSVF